MAILVKASMFQSDIKNTVYSMDDRNLENPRYAKLINSLKDGTCIFLGAGVSKLAGYMLWEELAWKMVEIFRERYKKKSKGVSELGFSMKRQLLTTAKQDPIAVFDYLYSLDRESFFRDLESAFNDVDVKPEIYSKFSRFVRNDKSFFLQTNIDSGFQDFFSIQDDDITVSANLGEEWRKLNYIHGKLGIRDSYVFTRRQYDECYLDETSSVMRFLVKIFTNFNVVFIGYSLRDNEIHRAMSIARKNNKFAKAHYAFEPVYDLTSTEFRLKSSNMKNNYNLELVPYAIESEGYTGLYSELDRLNTIINKTITLQQNLTRKAFIGEDNGYIK